MPETGEHKCTAENNLGAESRYDLGPCDISRGWLLPFNSEQNAPFSEVFLHFNDSVWKYYQLGGGMCLLCGMCMNRAFQRAVA
jgi:hypothetical protein